MFTPAQVEFFGPNDQNVEVAAVSFNASEGNVVTGFRVWAGPKDRSCDTLQEVAEWVGQHFGLDSVDTQDFLCRLVVFFK
jgi:hypothetical protein